MQSHICYVEHLRLSPGSGCWELKCGPTAPEWGTGVPPLLWHKKQLPSRQSQTLREQFHQEGHLLCASCGQTIQTYSLLNGTLAGWLLKPHPRDEETEFPENLGNMLHIQTLSYLVSLHHTARPLRAETEGGLISGTCSHHCRERHVNTRQEE